MIEQVYKMKTDASGFPENVRRPGIRNPVKILSEKLAG